MCRRWRRKMTNERTIWSDVISFIKATPNLLGYDVIQAAQAQIIDIQSPILVLDMIGAPRYSWQGTKDIPLQNGKMEHQELFYQEYVFQLTALKKRSMEDIGLTSMDVLNLVAIHLQSEYGVNMMTQAGYGIERIKEIRTGYFLNSNDVYERQPSFDFTLNRKQVLTSEIPALSGMNGVCYQV